MRKKDKRLLLISGAISLIMGITGAIPSFLNKTYYGLGASAFFVIMGVIFLTLSQGD